MTKMPLKENISKVFFVFSQCFFCYYHVSLGTIWYFTRYKKTKNNIYVYATRRLMGGIHTIRVVSLDVQKCIFTTSLEALVCPFSCGVVCVDVDGPVCHWWACFLLLLLPLIPRKIQLDPLSYWYFNLVFIFYFNFDSWLFFRSFIFIYIISSFNPIQKLSKINHIRSMYQICKRNNVSTCWQYKCSDYIPNFNLNAVNIS